MECPVHLHMYACLPTRGSEYSRSISVLPGMVLHIYLYMLSRSWAGSATWSVVCIQGHRRNTTNAMIAMQVPP